MIDMTLVPYCVLIVDDEPSIRNLLLSFLNLLSYQCETASNGK
mgnify:CR=1 FL=1